MRIERLTGSIDAELRGVNLVNAFPDDGPRSKITGLLQQKVPFPLDPDIFRPDYMAFFLRFGVLEDR